jgi:thiol-disulfide isomerase/thioredoxin
MFKKSLFLVLGCLLLVIIPAFASRYLSLKQLPSAYDPGISVETAFKTSKVPLLIEFYSDACTTCRKVTPVLHRVVDTVKGQVTLVMVDVTNPENQSVAQLFGVRSIPDVYVFDFKKMKKHPLDIQALQNPTVFRQKLLEAVSGNSKA